MPTYLFAGGGTGGHLYPALAIAERLAAHDASARALFVCSARPIDAQILSGEGVDFEPIGARPFGLRPMTLARFLRSWGGVVRQTRNIIVRERSAAPDGQVRLIAMGGFVAAPAAQAARAEGVGVTLINLDAIPGKANRWIARRADVALTSADGRCPKAWERIPPIVRASAVVEDSPEACRTTLGLDPKTPTLLVTGGSQGAGSINSLLTHLAVQAAEPFRGWQVIHQCGANGEQELRAAYKSAGIPALVKSYFTDMGTAWRAADLAITRCGAGAVAEAWANRTPSFFLPYPYHRDEHQRWNAMPLVDAGGALLERDLIEPEANLAVAGKTISTLLGDPSRIRAMAEALERLGPANGAERAAQRILDLRR